jgi:hypothetical protein
MHHSIRASGAFYQTPRYSLFPGPVIQLRVKKKVVSISYSPKPQAGAHC